MKVEKGENKVEKGSVVGGLPGFSFAYFFFLLRIDIVHLIIWLFKFGNSLSFSRLHFNLYVHASSLALDTFH